MHGIRWVLAVGAVVVVSCGDVRQGEDPAAPIESPSPSPAGPVVDLTVQSVSVTPVEIEPGDSVVATVVLENAGETATAASGVAFYLAQGDTFGGNPDTVVTLGELDPGEVAQRAGVIATDASLPDGTYTVFAVVDVADVVLETDEDNNVGSSALTLLTAPPPSPSPTGSGTASPSPTASAAP